MRFKDRSGATVSPGEFIPIAEENGMILPMSWMLLEKVCAFWQEHKTLPLDSISMNLSLQQFVQEDIAEKFKRTLIKYGIDAHKVKVEITESLFAEDKENVINKMQQLIDTGVGFYLDDFGSGYSNLAYVVKLPFECIKLDKTLIEDIDKDESSLELLSSFVAALKCVASGIIVEGVERQNQFTLIRRSGADMIQGFYFSKPLAEDDLITFLRTHSQA